jgi:hypothetical protein
MYYINIYTWTRLGMPFPINSKSLLGWKKNHRSSKVSCLKRLIPLVELVRMTLMMQKLYVLFFKMGSAILAVQLVKTRSNKSLYCPIALGFHFLASRYLVRSLTCCHGADSVLVIIPCTKATSLGGGTDDKGAGRRTHGPINIPVFFEFSAVT